MCSATEAFARDIDRPSSIVALNDIPVFESVKPPLKEKSASGLVGSARRVMASFGLSSDTVPMEKLDTETLAVRLGYGNRPIAPSTWTATPATTPSNTSVAPGLMVAPVASLPPKGAKSSDAVFTRTESTTGWSAGSPPPGTSWTTANGLRAIASGVGPEMEMAAMGLSTSRAALSDTGDPGTIPLALAQAAGSVRFLTRNDGVGNEIPGFSALPPPPFCPATSSTD